MTTDFPVLVVDDEEEARKRLARGLAKEFQADTAAGGEEALDRLAQAAYGLVLLDHKMPGMSGLETLRRIKREHPQTPVIMVTAVDDMALAVECMRSGAEDFAVKTPALVEALRPKIRALAERRELAAENRRLRAELDRQARFDELLGESAPFTAMLAQVRNVAALPIPVLVHGESGTGKELVARALHANGPRRGRAFLAVNCGEFPDTLLASELFGHVKGAFTGAEAKQGLFTAADGGTLFLDEIGESSAGVQVQLLRVLDSGEVRPVGSTTPRQVDVRVVAATNRDLEHEVRQGRFRTDLFHRLWQFPIRVPPLRERREDVALLAAHFLARYAREFKKPLAGFSQEALHVLERYDWPGNVRELRNVVARAVVDAGGEEIQPHDLPLGPRPPAAAPGAAGAPAGEALLAGEWRQARAAFERAYVARLLRETGGNVSEAARRAGLDRRNFRDKMQAHGLAGNDLD